MKVWVYTANVKCNPWMVPNKVRTCFRIVQNSFSHYSLGGLQEINRVPWYYRSLMKKVLSPAKNQFNTHVEVPLVIGNQWTCLEHHADLAHKGRAGTSPNRYVSHGVFHHEPFTVAVVDFHFVSGAWNNKRKSFKKWRQQMWQKNWDLGKQVVVNYLQQGYPVFIVGDFNRLKVDKFVDSQVWLVNHGIDKIACIPSSSIGIKDLGRGVLIDTPSDHPLRGAEVELYLK